jgi:chromosome segregation ATPase
MTPDGKGISRSSPAKTPELAASRATVNSLTSLLETASIREGELRAQLHSANQRVQDLEREKHEQDLVAQTQLETIQQQLQQLQPQRDQTLDEEAAAQVSTMAVVTGPARAPRAYNPMWGGFPGYVHPMLSAPAPAEGTAVGALAAALEAAGEREGELKVKLAESQASAAAAAIKLADAIAIARAEVEDSVKERVMALETEVRNLSAELEEKANAAQTFKASLNDLQDKNAILEQERMSAKARVRELEARMLIDAANAEAKLKIVLGDVEAAKAETETVRGEAKHKIEANWDQANRSVAMAQEDAKKDRDAIVEKETELIAARELIAALEQREAEVLERVAALELQLSSAQTQLKSTETQLKSTETQLKESQDRESIATQADEVLREDLNKAEARVTALLQELEATRAAAMESSRAAKSASARAESMAVALASAKSGSSSDMKLATAEARVTALEVELSIAQRSAALNAKEADRDQHALLSKAEQAGKDSMMSTVNKLEDTIARLQDANKEANAEVERLKTRLSAAEKIAAHANSSLGDASDRTRKAFEDASAAKNEARTARAELQAAKDRVAALKRELDLAMSRAKQADAEATAAMTRAHIVEADMEEIKRRAFAAEAELAAARDAADANERKRKDAEGRMEALRSTLRHARDDLGLGWTDRPRPIGKLPTPPTDDTDDDAAMQAQAEDIVLKLAAAKARLHPVKGLAPRAKNRHD